jgi:tetratricopeptide (TPR) repeat protein
MMEQWTCIAHYTLANTVPQLQKNEQSRQPPEKSLASQAEVELARGNQHLAARRWSEAAHQFRSAADLYQSAGEHAKEGDALARAAKAYENLQSWRIAAEMWEETARALGRHTVPCPSEPKIDEGEAWLWAGNTYFWSDQHYESFYAHVKAGQAFEAAQNWPRAERAYRSGAISKARSLGTLYQFNRDAHDIYKTIEGVDLIKALKKVAKNRQRDNPENKEFAFRSHIDSLFSIRRALEVAGNLEEARKVYKHEINARRKYAWSYWRFSQLLWYCFLRWVLGYGENPLNLLIGSIILYIGLFPLLYYTCCGTVKNANDVFDLMYFSVVTVTTVGYGDMSPVGWARLFASIESILGLITFGLLVAVLVKRVSR